MRYDLRQFPSVKLEALRELLIELADLIGDDLVVWDGTTIVVTSTQYQRIVEQAIKKVQP